MWIRDILVRIPDADPDPRGPYLCLSDPDADPGGLKTYW
jgi:hypothetical protein